MKVTKAIVNLLYKRAECAKRLNSYDCEVRKWLDNHSINNEERIDLETYNGCMLISEPDNYCRLTLELIEKS